MTEFKQIILETKDLSRFPDWQHIDERSLRRRMSWIRDFCEKTSKQPVTIFDLSEYMKIDVPILADLMGLNKTNSANNGR